MLIFGIPILKLFTAGVVVFWIHMMISQCLAGRRLKHRLYPDGTYDELALIHHKIGAACIAGATGLIAILIETQVKQSPDPYGWISPLLYYFHVSCDVAYAGVFGAMIWFNGKRNKIAHQKLAIALCIDALLIVSTGSYMLYKLPT